MNLGSTSMQLLKTHVNAHFAIDREEKASKHIPVLGHFDNETLIDKDGKLIKIFSLSGIDFMTQHQIDLDIQKNRRNNLFKQFNSQVAVYFWTLRRKTAAYPQGQFSQLFAKEVNNNYKGKIERMAMFHNQLYMAIITKPPEGKINKISQLIKRANHQVNKSAYDDYLKKMSQELEQITHKVLSTLQDYDIRLLKVNPKEPDDMMPISESLSFLSELLNLEPHRVPLLPANAAFYLPRKRFSFNAHSGAIEITAADFKKRFAAVISIKEYSNATYAGMLDELSNLRIEYNLTQSFRFYDSQSAKTKLKNQQKDLLQAKDDSRSQTLQITESLDEAASGDVAFGKHHLTLLCFTDTLVELNKSIADIVAVFSKRDIIAVREDVACECGFWAQLPGNFKYIAREADISSKNLASFASLHNYPKGKISGNYWGEAVTVLETVAGSPYYFNFHFKDVGNTLVLGKMGSGKTLVIGFLLLQSLKFGGKRVLFDKDRGLEILVRSVGGTYELLKPGIHTGFNPCQLDDTSENRVFLTNLFYKMLSLSGKPLDEGDKEVIDKAVSRLYTLPFADRQLKHIAPFFGAKSLGSLRARFDEWHSNRANAWLFDNPTDSLNLNADVIGFELGKILEDQVCKTPALMYLFHRVSQQLEGQRGGIFIDEGWVALSDDYFRPIIEDLSRTPRKKNNFLCLSTQAADDTLKSSISTVLQESAACKVFFPNPSAKREVYIDGFGLSEQEYQLIKSLNDEDRYFLLNYGRGKESVIVKLNLQGLDDVIAIISAREQTLKLLDEIRANVGDDPQVWLPIFHTSRKMELKK